MEFPMFTKNLNDFQKNYVAIIGVEEGLRFNNLNSDVNKTVEEVRSFVTRMESVVGLKFNASQEIGPMTGLSEVNKAKYRAEKLRSNMENIHSNFNVLSKNDEENIRTFEFLNEHISAAYKIRQEAMRGGDESKFNKLATDIRELSVFIPPAIRQESICMNKWPGLVYRAEGIISWIGDKIKALIDWVLGLFGFGKNSKSKKEADQKKTEDGKKHEEKFASTHQATHEQQMQIKKAVDELEKEYGGKYDVGAYGKADTLYLKDVDVGIEKGPITKEKAKEYLEKAAKLFPVGDKGASDGGKASAEDTAKEKEEKEKDMRLLKSHIADCLKYVNIELENKLTEKREKEITEKLYVEKNISLDTRELGDLVKGLMTKEELRTTHDEYNESRKIDAAIDRMIGKFFDTGEFKNEFSFKIEFRKALNKAFSSGPAPSESEMNKVVKPIVENARKEIAERKKKEEEAEKKAAAEKEKKAKEKELFEKTLNDIGDNYASSDRYKNIQDQIRHIKDDVRRELRGDAATEIKAVFDREMETALKKYNDSEGAANADKAKGLFTLKGMSPSFYIDCDESGKYHATDQYSFGKFKIREFEKMVLDLLGEAERFLRETNDTAPDEVFDQHNRNVANILQQNEKTKNPASLFPSLDKEVGVAYHTYIGMHQAIALTFNFNNNSSMESVNTANNAREESIKHKYTKEEIDTFFNQRDIFLTNIENFISSFEKRFTSQSEKLKSLKYDGVQTGGPVYSAFSKTMVFIAKFNTAFKAISATAENLQRANRSDFY